MNHRVKLQYKEYIKQTLTAFHDVGYTSAIVAGGAIRDSIMNTTVNDIDVYLLDPAHCANSPTDIMNKRILYSIFSHVQHEQDRLIEHSTTAKVKYYMNDLISQVWNVFIGSAKIQVIVLKKDPVDFVLENFNIGLCQAYYDNTSITLTPEFLNDMNNKTLTIVGEKMTQVDMDNTIRFHLPKLRAKFPNFKIQTTKNTRQLFTEMGGVYASHKIT